MSDLYQLVRLKNGACTVRSTVDAETFHPVIGPVAEAEALYIRQLSLLERLTASPTDFVLWDVGLGAAANPLTFLNAAAHIPKRLRIVSFDHTLAPLRFALAHSHDLGYLSHFHDQAEQLAHEQKTHFVTPGGLEVDWELRLGDFPSFLRTAEAQRLPKPHAIFYDAYSPLKNPAMWTLPVFKHLYQLLDPAQSCAMPTYSRSTLLRVTLLVAGFYVGVGHATGEKDQTTIAANTLSLIDQPLTSSWLETARRSGSAEPLHDPVYTQAPLLPSTLHQLLHHSQFT